MSTGETAVQTHSVRGTNHGTDGTDSRSHFTANRFFDGRLLVNQATGETTVVEDDSVRGLEVADGSVFSEGDTFEILEIKGGDGYHVPLSVEVRREGGEYVVDGPEGVTTNQ